MKVSYGIATPLVRVTDFLVINLCLIGSAWIWLSDQLNVAITISLLFSLSFYLSVNIPASIFTGSKDQLRRNIPPGREPAADHRLYRGHLRYSTTCCSGTICTPFWARTS
ncbi:hypothetical protein O0544_18440 [Edwardsiella anguillarum]|nr:hypothetical protein [Edwardsiella anguillarum]